MSSPNISSSGAVPAGGEDDGGPGRAVTPSLAGPPPTDEALLARLTRTHGTHTARMILRDHAEHGCYGDLVAPEATR